MPVIKINDRVFAVGANDPKRRLFDELIPLPDGTTYNSYLVKGSEKTALIDTVDPDKSEILLQNLEHADITRIDYVIALHAEQDHSGNIPLVMEKYPSAKLVSNVKCLDMLSELLDLDKNRFYAVEDNSTISLGDKTLEFIHAPWAHWPETMLAYLKEDSILFPCDLFGSHLGTNTLTAPDSSKLLEAAKRYYAEIMMPFRNSIKKHVERLSHYDIKVIAPSHGPIHRKPGIIMGAYENWISDSVKNEVIIPYVSMHGSTKAMVDHFVSALVKRNLEARPYDLSVTDIGQLAMELVEAATVVIGSPTVLAGAHPQALYAAYLTGALRPKTKFISIIGSYGWGGRMSEQLGDMTKNLSAELIEPVIIKGYPSERDLLALDKLAETISSKHGKAGLLNG